MEPALEGVKVLDFTWAIAGTGATQCLANFGATVIRVESRKRLDITRVSEPFKDKITDPDRAGLFVHFNSSKYSITLDLTHPRSRPVITRLVEWADVVVENFRPGVMKRLGLDYEELKKVKPDIIMLNSSILGQRGVEEGVAGFGNTGAALTGHYYLTGWPEAEPTTPASIAYADVVQYVFTTTVVIGALDYRRRTGRGQCIDITQIEPMGLFLAQAVLDYQLNNRVPQRQGNRHPQAAPHAAFPCKGDDRWIALAVFNDEEWQGLCQAMGHPEWCTHPRFATAAGRKANEAELEGLVAGWTAEQEASEAVARLQACGVPAGMVQDAADLSRCPQLAAWGSFVPLTRPGTGTTLHPTPPVKLSLTPAQVRPAPALGEHNELVYTQILGLSDEEFATLLAEGVLE